jgi:glyoxalase family protein
LTDETAELLGEVLRIPEWFEPQRKLIEARVQPITLHKATKENEAVL